jgi:DNA-binding CsgD family transcriptional regulator
VDEWQYLPLRGVSGHFGEAETKWALMLVEAAIRAGDYEAAAIAHKSLSERALAADTPWALGLRARCAALLAEGADAEGYYLESISQLRRCRMAVDLARAYLLYGQWLRRAKRRRDARAGRELQATGETLRKRTVETAVELIAQEAQVARLARDGLSNPEIGASLFISARTAQYHLGKVFAKLGISSRCQLAQALPGTPATIPAR